MKTKIIISNGLILLLLIICSFHINLFAQISPGNLTYAHSNLEGMSNCTKCHVLGKQLEVKRCLSCHNEIKSMIDKKIGYHSSREVISKDCWNCHSEHHGRAFQIIYFNKNNFDHNKTGFILEGKHSQLKCEECHQKKFILDPLLKNRTNTYLGLNTSCNSCHVDVHQNTLGNNCSSCHSFDKFKPAVLFNHDNSKYKLTGAHLNVDCKKCHLMVKLNGKMMQKFTGLQFENCSPCHRDIHKNMFGNNCLKCHSTESFKLIKKGSFDHNATKFPLKGAHNTVKCSGCHGTNLISEVKYDKCTDCHKDYHFNEFTKNNIIEDCKDCHNVKSFKDVLFSVQDHDKIKFQLEGSHLAVPCESCHYKKNEWHFRNIGLKCIDCHENIHGNELTNKYMKGNNCTSCHNTVSWQVITFDHNLTSFKLLGKHILVTCSKCHSQINQQGKLVSKFASLNSDCTSCHKDIHFGQFDSERSEQTSVCENCHDFNNWKPVKFDHDKTSFILTGKHEKVKCSGCHKSVNVNGNIFIKYKLKEFKCASCHS